MTPRRVVITGAGVASPVGNSLEEVKRSLQSDRHGIVTMPEWDKIGDLRTRLGGVVQGLDLERRWPRKQTRTMGRVALMALHATEQALAMAGLQGDEIISSGHTGLAYGSTSGSSEALADFCTTLFAHMNMRGLQSTSFLRFMAHTCAANLSQFFGVRGRIIPTNSACTSGAQAIGYAYEAIKYGMQDVMIAGGSDEMHFTTAVTFDLMFATSASFNTQPELSPRPFDRRRDGLHITAPSETGMRAAMALSLRDAGVAADQIDYINAHGTATDIGDVAESAATRDIFGRAAPISSSKSFTGHTMGACGAIEAIFCLGMLQDSFIAPTRNLEEVDPRCADLDYVREVRQTELRTIMTNNFAFGGVNTSLILGRHE